MKLTLSSSFPQEILEIDINNIKWIKKECEYNRQCNYPSVIQFKNPVKTKTFMGEQIEWAFEESVEDINKMIELEKFNNSFEKHLLDENS